ncbi:hypothetical protein B0H17DRAFT_1190811 [Mycena rosella]|uniref:Uncharacterized protein n=1 Tax=Mycena rosella TaxID=1033263 RepID=A0AAD7MC25_MYCRO|nr:hypothetical protein B0H17DRAFT_1190811 [Mycena rosella]
MPRDTGPEIVLARRNGLSIGRTEATRQYRLATSDLDSIRPVEVRAHGWTLRQFYNRKDVITLDARLNCAVPDPSERAAEDGPQIHKLDVMRELQGLQMVQMARIGPVSEIPHPDDSEKGPIFVYNRSDVEALHASVRAGAEVTRGYAALVYPSLSPGWVPRTRATLRGARINPAGRFWTERIERLDEAIGSHRIRPRSSVHENESRSEPADV